MKVTIKDYEEYRGKYKEIFKPAERFFPRYIFYIAFIFKPLAKNHCRQNMHKRSEKAKKHSGRQIIPQVCGSLYKFVYTICFSVPLIQSDSLPQNKYNCIQYGIYYNLLFQLLIIRLFTIQQIIYIYVQFFWNLIYNERVLCIVLSNSFFNYFLS